MPIRSKAETPSAELPYFTSLAELEKRKPRVSDSVVPHTPRRTPIDGRGNLLVCHDYKGGYTENPHEMAYTFNFWSACDVFVYFSHHRVTIPPVGWINAAHRQGVKILGTLIFEGPKDETDCMRLVIGKLPHLSKTGPAERSNGILSFPVTPYYARILADIARERGFDGYLLNFECPLQGNTEQARALAAWITLLRNEILSKVGSHAQVVWYDSVLVTGQLAWQDRLNSYNLPFFLASSSIFTNYTWPPNYPALTAQYFFSLNPLLTGDDDQSHPFTHHKSMQDIYMGVDVWGRGSHGGGGFGCYRALTHVAPKTLGLSVALFGPAWSWETRQDELGFNWEVWWEHDSKLWVGPISGEVSVPEAPRRKNEPECPHGPFIPITSFFAKQAPPDPSMIPLVATFCPGVGKAWFVNGVKVFESPTGWTDIDKNTSLGDLAWPCPAIKWVDDRQDSLPLVVPSINMTTAWCGGSSLQLTYTNPNLESAREEAAFQCVWVPLQSLSITGNRSYMAEAIYKTKDLPNGVDIDVALSVKTLAAEDGLDETTDFEISISPESITTSPLSEGWTKCSIEFSHNLEHGPTTLFAVGLILSVVVSEDPSQTHTLSLLLGQISVSPLLPPSLQSEHTSRILWAHFERSDGESHQSTSTSSISTWPLTGTISWEVSISLPAVESIAFTQEDPTSTWRTQPFDAWFPKFLYFNIYAQAYSDDGTTIGKPQEAIWIGTSTWNSNVHAVCIEKDDIMPSMEVPKKMRIYVQGMSDRGDILDWRDCAFVDAIV